jgi:citrate lyase alpha subunit
VQGDGFSYWRVKFRKQYAYKKATSNKTLKKKYQSRRQVLREGTGVSFHHGHSEGEQKVIAVLKDLINGETSKC